MGRLAVFIILLIEAKALRWPSFCYHKALPPTSRGRFLKNRHVRGTGTTEELGLLPGKRANPEFFGPFPSSCPRLRCWAGAARVTAPAPLTRLLVGGEHGLRHHRRRSPARRDHYRLPAPRRRPRLRGLLAPAGPLPLRPLPPGGRRSHRGQGHRPGRPGPGPLGPAQLLGLPDGLPPLPPLPP